MSSWKSCLELKRSLQQFHFTSQSRRSLWRLRWDRKRAHKLRGIRWLILAAMEEILADETQPVFYRIMACWLMLQSWGTLRFADHRGLEPINIRFEARTLIAKLTRSKTLGSDKPVSSRIVVVDPEACFRNRTWTKDGWSLLHERNHLLPAPSGNCKGVQCRELRYDTAFAAQTSVGITILPQVQALQFLIRSFLESSQRTQLSSDGSFRLGSIDSRQKLVGRMVR